MNANDFTIASVGIPEEQSPLRGIKFVADEDRVLDSSLLSDLKLRSGSPAASSLEKAGPRRRVFFPPGNAKAAILTAGGLCPGLNDVIKGVVNTLCTGYGLKSVLGIRYGYRGLARHGEFQPLPLDPDVVDDIHSHGGTILGSSRGHQDIGEMADSLVSMGVDMLFCVGGDGTLRGARLLADELLRRKLPIAVVGIPKTIDNDISFTDRSFGFETAVYATNSVIEAAHAEAKGAFNGIGLVKLMGRESGFIAAFATLANSVVNYCFVPESPIVLDGENGFLPHLFRRLERKRHAVIVVAEGAGQEFFKAARGADKSGNVIFNDIGIFLKTEIAKFAKKNSAEVNIKYFDPSYMIRSGDAIGTDAVFCIMLAQNAVHAATAGKTSMMIGHHNGEFVHVPLSLATSARKKLDVDGPVWQSVLEITGQNKP